MKDKVISRRDSYPRRIIDKTKQIFGALNHVHIYTSKSTWNVMGVDNIIQNVKKKISQGLGLNVFYTSVYHRCLLFLCIMFRKKHLIKYL